MSWRVLVPDHPGSADRAGPLFQLERIRCPVLVVWGEHDRQVAVSGAERIKAALPDARVELLPGCGHCPQVEEPDRLAELLAGFPAAGNHAVTHERA